MYAGRLFFVPELTQKKEIVSKWPCLRSDFRVRSFSAGALKSAEKLDFSPRWRRVVELQPILSSAG